MHIPSNSETQNRPPLPTYHIESGANVANHGAASEWSKSSAMRPQSKNSYREDVADMESPEGKRFDRNWRINQNETNKLIQDGLTRSCGYTLPCGLDCRFEKEENAARLSQHWEMSRKLRIHGYRGYTLRQSQDSSPIAYKDSLSVAFFILKSAFWWDVVI